MFYILIFVEIIIFIGMVDIEFKILLELINNGQELINIKFLGFLKFDLFINFYDFNYLHLII